MSNEQDSFIPTIENLGMNSDSVIQYKEYLDKKQGLILVTGGKATGKTSTILAGYDYLTILGHSVMFFTDSANVPKETTSETFDRMLAFGAQKIIIDGITDKEIIRRAVNLSEQCLVMISIPAQSDMGAMLELMNAHAIKSDEWFKTPVLFMNHDYSLGTNTPPGLRSMITG